MTVPARSSVDDALDRMERHTKWIAHRPDGEAFAADVATVRDELQRLREDYEKQREYADDQYRKALAAEAESQRLREERDEAWGDLDVVTAEVRRLTEGLRVALTMIERASFDAHDREWAREQTTNLRALLVASPPDGGGAK